MNFLVAAKGFGRPSALLGSSLLYMELNHTNTSVERYEFGNNQIHRFVLRRDGSEIKTSVDANGSSDFDSAWLKSSEIISYLPAHKTIRLADLFCGTGPMTLGVVEAGKALNINIEPMFAIDFEANASKNYALNFPSANVVTDDINNIINGGIGTSKTDEELNLIKKIGSIDFMIAGPPCQGHSDLNNHTRRNDPRNLLIFKACRFIEIFRPKYFIIENVQGIRHDKNHTLDDTKKLLTSWGYHLSEHLLMASKYGVAQNRRRFLLVGSIDKIEVDTSLYEVKQPRGVMWAIGDMIDKYNPDSIFNSSATHSAINQKRIDYLFQNNLHELPYQQRPKCQQSPNNRYTSVYGRMYEDLPAPTITSGFGSVGQGRFCHPTCRRTLTPHEAARVQFIPDKFIFDNSLTRVALQKMIGNAVPPKLTYIIGLELLR